MTKTIEMPARAKAKKQIDDWVETRQPLAPTAPTIKPKRLTIDLDPELHRELKIDCVSKDVQIADRLRAMIRRELGHAN